MATAEVPISTVSVASAYGLIHSLTLRQVAFLPTFLENLLRF